MKKPPPYSLWFQSVGVNYGTVWLFLKSTCHGNFTRIEGRFFFPPFNASQLKPIIATSNQRVNRLGWTELYWSIFALRVIEQRTLTLHVCFHCVFLFTCKSFSYWNDLLQYNYLDDETQNPTQFTVSVFDQEDSTQKLQKSWKYIDCIKYAELLQVLHLLFVYLHYTMSEQLHNFPEPKVLSSYCLHFKCYVI